MTPHLQQKGDKKMNKEKALKIINEIKEEIKKNELEEARIYVDTWVIGELSQLESKINGGCNYYPAYATYADLFTDFINHFFCRNIDPAIKVYAIASLFTYENRKLICELYKQLFNKEQRRYNALKVAYDFDWSEKNEKSQFEIIRRFTETSMHHD